MKKNITYIICSFLLPLQLWSQVGIGTSNPIGAFHIDGASNSDASDSSTLTDDVVLLPNGNLGVGNASPKVKLDVRGNTNSSAIGLGNPTDTELTAANAKEGAIKYYYTSDTDKGIKYSNGSTCIKRPSTDIKALVFANKNSSQIINASTTTSITGWTESADRTDSFASGVFTAPRDGVYIATFNIALTNQAIANDSRFEIRTDLNIKYYDWSSNI